MLNNKYSYRDCESFAGRKDSLPVFRSRIFCFPHLRCNNNCRHCFVDEKSRQAALNLNAAKQMVARNSAHFDWVHIGGGEPTLYPGLLELIGFSKRLGKKVCLFSNCRKMSDNSFSDKIVSSGLDSMFIPLHSHVAKEHDYMTQREGSFKETIKGMDNLRARGFKDAHIIIIVQKNNYKKLNKLADFLVNREVSSVSVESLIYSGNAEKNFKTLAVRASQAAPYIEDAFDIFNNADVPFYTTSFGLCLFDKKYWKFFLNERFSLIATNINSPSLSMGKKFGTSGTAIPEKCKDCRLELFCPGLWNQYYKFFGDQELKPYRKIETRDILTNACSLTLERFFSSNKAHLNS